MLFISDSILKFDMSKCMQCGGCIASCSHDALTAVRQPDGLHMIRIDTDQCTRCNACVRTCPAGRMPFAKLPSLEDAVSIVLASSTNGQVRHAASSGAAGRILFKTALDSNMCERGYSLSKTAIYPWAEGKYWSECNDTSELPNSIYHPILALQNFPRKPKQKQIVVIGCPCQLDAVSHLAKKETDILKIAIYCKQQKHLGLMRHVSRTLGVEPGGIHADSPVRWRGDGWPGTVAINSRKASYESIAAVPFGWHLWRVPGCKQCANPYGNEVDITLSDPWGIEQNGPGKTLTVAWTPKGAALLERARTQLDMTPVSTETAQAAFNTDDELATAALAPYYAGKRPLPFPLRALGKMEQTQCTVLETILESVPMPPLFLRIFAHFPNMRTLAKHFYTG